MVYQNWELQNAVHLQIAGISEDKSTCFAVVHTYVPAARYKYTISFSDGSTVYFKKTYRELSRWARIWLVPHS
jgi:hypothetical protein